MCRWLLMIKFKWSNLILFLLLFSFVLLVGGTMPYFLLYIFLLYFLIPLFHCLITLERLQGFIYIPEGSHFVGESIEIEYRLENRSFLSIPFLEIHSEITKNLTGKATKNIILNLNRKESYSNKESVVLNRRGYYKLGQIGIIIKDVFKLYSFKKKFVNKTSLLIYPEIIELTNFKITAGFQPGELLVQNTTFIDKNRTKNLRDYIEGEDSIKSIHWKLSAKMDIPIIKEYESRVDTNVVIFIDNYFVDFKKDVDRYLEDRQVDIALSISNYCLNQNIEVNLQTQEGENFTEIIGEGKSDLKFFLENLAKFNSNGKFPIKSLIGTRMETIQKGSTVIIITTRLDKSVGSICIQLKIRKLNPVIAIVLDNINNTGYLDLNIEKNLIQEGIPVYLLNRDKNVKETLEAYYG